MTAKHNVFAFENQIDELFEVLYPMADQAAGGPREQDDLVKRLQAV